MPLVKVQQCDMVLPGREGLLSWPHCLGFGGVLHPVLLLFLPCRATGAVLAPSIEREGPLVGTLAWCVQISKPPSEQGKVPKGKVVYELLAFLLDSQHGWCVRACVLAVPAAVYADGLERGSPALDR